MAKIVFFHGLNTYGDDDLHLGPFKLGQMHDYLEDAFHARDIEFICVTGIGAERIEVLAARAFSFLNEAGYFSTTPSRSKDKLHFLGHSMGGLVARALAARPEIQDQVGSILTIGTPHQGTSMADFGLSFKLQHPFLQRTLRLTGYDTAKKLDVYRHFTTEAMNGFANRFPLHREIQQFSLICEAQGRDLSLPFQIAKLTKFMRDRPPGDGLISSTSQCYGKTLGPYQLDHLSELGYFLHARPAARKKASVEFNRMIDTISTLVSN